MVRHMKRQHGAGATDTKALPEHTSGNGEPDRNEIYESVERQHDDEVGNEEKEQTMSQVVNSDDANSCCKTSVNTQGLGEHKISTDKEEIAQNTSLAIESENRTRCEMSQFYNSDQQDGFGGNSDRTVQTTIQTACSHIVNTNEKTLQLKEQRHTLTNCDQEAPQNFGQTLEPNSGNSFEMSSFMESPSQLRLGNDSDVSEEGMRGNTEEIADSTITQEVSQLWYGKQ